MINIAHEFAYSIHNILTDSVEQRGTEEALQHPTEQSAARQKKSLAPLPASGPARHLQGSMEAALARSRAGQNAPCFRLRWNKVLASRTDK